MERGRGHVTSDEERVPEDAFVQIFGIQTPGMLLHDPYSSFRHLFSGVEYHKYDCRVKTK